MKKLLVSLLFVTGFSWAEAERESGPEAQSEVQVTEYVIMGEAYRQGTYSKDQADGVIYTEKYTAMDENQKVQVDYYDPEGKRFAYKTLDFSSGDTTPGYEMIDERQASRDGAEVMAKEIKVYTGREGKRKQKILNHEQNQAVDAGFAPLVRQHWKKLIAGDDIDFYFAYPSRRKNIELTLRAVGFSATPFTEDLAGYYFSMTINNRFLAMFVDPVFLAFDSEQRLIRYQGRSNLVDNQGEPQDVFIVYRYLGSNL